MSLLLKDIHIKSFKGIDDIKISDCGRVNAFVGKNNSGKSTILQAIEMASAAFTYYNGEGNHWGTQNFMHKLEDVFPDVGEFETTFNYIDESRISLTSNSKNNQPEFIQQPTQQQIFKSILLVPNSGIYVNTASYASPKSIMDQIKRNDISSISSLGALYAIKYYSDRGERGFSREDYESIIKEIRYYFPDIQGVESDQTDTNDPTLTYAEFGKKLDILYSGTGLKHFLDVLIKVTLSNANIVLLDEPEVGLHPDLQREFMEYLIKLAEKKDLQIFISTHSPILLNYLDKIQCYRIINKQGKREVVRVPQEAGHLLMSDLGIRPSDIFNSDICLMVEGQSDIIFFKHILDKLYKDYFAGITIAINQYGGDAAAAISGGVIGIENITAAQKYTFWIRDRDASYKDNPSINTTKFKNSLEKARVPIHVTSKREIEFYYPLEVHLDAQGNDGTKRRKTKSIYKGNQREKYVTEAKKFEICVPKGIYLKRLLEKHLTSKDQLDKEIIDIFENTLMKWKDEILGE